MSAAQSKGLLPKALETSLHPQDAVLRAQQEAKLRQAARLFESQFIASLFKEMRKSLPKNGLVSGGYGEELFTGMLDQARADVMAQTGQVGIAGLLEKQLGGARFKSTAAARAGAYNLKPPANLERVADRSESSTGQAAETEATGSITSQPDLPASEPTGASGAARLVDMEGQPLVELERAAAAQREAAPKQNSSVTLPMPMSDEEESAETVLPAQPQPSASPAAALNNKAVQEMALPVQGAVTSTFGLRLHPITGDVRPHHGLDLAAPSGTPVRAAMAGVVRFAGQAGDYGRLVVLEHDDGSSTFYGHCRSLSVTPGQRVAQGQMVGRVGMTGLASGPHLHFEVRDTAGRPQDPLPMVAKALNTSS